MYPFISIGHRVTLKHRVCAAILLLGVTLVGAAAAHAEEWPARPVKIVVPYGPGGIADVFARITADRLTKLFGKPFVVESRGGAGGAIGTEFAVHSPPDGYTLYFAGGGQFSVVPLMQKLAYDPVKDLTPISMVTLNGMAFAVNNDLPVRSLREFIDYARANPGKLNYGATGLGASSHLAPAAFAARERLDMVVVPYTATPPSIVALLNGTIQLFFGNVSDVLGSVQGGKVRLLAFSTEKRLPQFPEIQTVSETVPDFVMTGWNGYFAPAGTPRPIIDRLAQAIAEVCHDPEVVKLMGELSVDAVGSTPQELAAAIAADLPVYRAAVEAAGLMRQ
ncbi:MAG TPA: tripartite tricarboxylate transporter substrate binding protein [Steroidobacteraceae bacterium]|jgi:tripartite-type tricarboxylate transporter receptor subunit TctC